MSNNANIEIRNVILPYDFSSASKNALEHAIIIARKFKADLLLVNVMDNHSAINLGIKGAKFPAYKETAEAKLKELTQGVFTLGKTEFQCHDGKWGKTIAHIAGEKQGVLMVIGSGGKGRDSYFDSGHVYKVVDAHHFPALMVKDRLPPNDYKSILSPLDEAFHTREKIPFVTLMASAFDSKVSIIGLQSHTDKESTQHMQAIMSQASHYIRMKVRDYHDKLVNSKNVVSDIIKNTKEEKPDLLVIMSNHEKTLANLFSGPYAQQISNQSPVPVLICPPRVSLVMGAVSI